MKKNDKFLNILEDIMKTIFIYIIISILFSQFVMRPFRVEGDSMLPNLKSRELGFSNVLSLKSKGVERFDVVIVSMRDTNRYLVKRVIGLPNETIEYKQNKLYVDGVIVEESFLDEDYINSVIDQENTNFTQDFGPIVLNEGEYFLLGDNRIRSSDSRTYGSFNEDEIVSKNGVVIYPFNKIRKLK